MTIRLVQNVYLADTARVLGAVELVAGVNIWYGASIRGDVAKVVIGANSNVQDNAVVHCDSGFPNVIGAHVTIGHGALVHGEAVGDQTLIGMGAVVLGHTRIGRRCVVAAGAVVPPGTVVPDEMLVLGVPGRIARPINDKERQYLDWLAPHYVKLAQLHHQSPADPRIVPWGTLA
jgi:carbonic anhydrase/acetyltransferase-like protein (isoleucine patch superfamily)